jgi:hypothetical protein
MSTTHAEYSVSKHPSRGWVVRRNGDPIGYRAQLFNAVSFATHLAEREATVSSLATHVSMAVSDLSWLFRRPLLSRVA